MVLAPPSSAEGMRYFNAAKRWRGFLPLGYDNDERSCDQRGVGGPDDDRNQDDRGEDSKLSAIIFAEIDEKQGQGD